MSQSNHQKSIHKMQRYIVSGVVLISAFGLSFPIAMARVSSTKQFSGQSVKSQDCANQTLKESKVIEWAKDCAPLKVEPLKIEPKKADAKPAEPQPIAAPPAAIESVAPIKPSIPPESKPNPKPSIPPLQLGSSGDSVMVLQEQLQLAGVFSGAVDGVFGTETELAVQNLQQKFNLEPTGIADTAIQARIGPK